MARERKANDASSTLTAGINDSVTSLTVDSATDFPTSPQFRIKVGDAPGELMLVTGVSGATFTVTRGIEGSTAISHSTSDPVTLVETQAGQLRHMRDWLNPMAELGKPCQLLDSSGNTLTASSFTDVNFGAASKSDVTGGPILITHNTQSPVASVALTVKSAPTAPWVLTVGFIPNLLNVTGNFPAAGPVVRDNTTGEFYFHALQCRDDGVWVNCFKYNSPTATSTSFLPNRDWTQPYICWYQIEDNNTNLIFRVSTDGLNYLEIGSEGRTAFLTPDEIGFGITNFGNVTTKAMATIVSWDES